MALPPGHPGDGKLADLLLAKPPAGLWIRLGAAALAMLIVLGVATVALPLRCLSSARDFRSCFASADAFLDRPSVPAPFGRPAPAGVALAPVASRTPGATAEPAPAPAPTPAGLIDATFGLLQPAAEAPAAGPPAAPVGDTGGVTVVPKTPRAGGPTTRRVATVTIRGDGSATPSATVAAPSAPAPSAAAAADTPAAGTPAPGMADTAASAADNGTVPAAGLPWPQPRPEAVAPHATAPASGVLRVSGSGANVRAGPSKSQTRLFALAPGQKVTVTESRRGWRRITDERGRQGWVDADYLTGAAR